MDALFQIVGCVLSSRPNAELIDEFVSQVRRERAVVVGKSAQGATFVRFSAPDARLVAIACQTIREQMPSLLRFGFAGGIKEQMAAGPDGLSISNRSIVQASDLAAGARDAEVLVSPQLAVLLIEAGFAFRSRQVRLPSGRMVGACALDLAAEAAEDTGPGRALPLDKRASDARLADAAGLRVMPTGAAGDESLGLLQIGRATGEAAPAMQRGADALGNVLRALAAQAEEMARKQAELEARHEAMLGKMTLVDDGGRAAAHLGELEAELDRQLARVQARLDFIDRLEQRIDHLQGMTEGIERALDGQLARHAEVESLGALCDTLVLRMDDARHQLEGVEAVQERLLPIASQVQALAQVLEASWQAIATYEGRLSELDRGAEAVDRKIEWLADREALVHSVKAEVDGIVQGSAGYRADLEFVTEHRSDLADLRAKVEDLIGRARDTDEKIASVESRRKAVEELHSRAGTVTHMLEDIKVNLEMLSEQRAVIDHVGEKLAHLDFTVQEAQNTLRALQREREVAERVAQGIKALRARGGAQKSG